MVIAKSHGYSRGLKVKRVQKVLALLLAAASTFLVGCAGGNQSAENKMIQLNARNGAQIDCTPTVYQEYLSLTDESDIAKLLMDANNKGILKPVPKSQGVVLSWKRDASSYNKYRVWISQNADLSAPVFQTETADTYVSVEGLLPGKYYWYVMDSKNNESAVDTFVVSDYVRSLDVDGIRNFRDLGGWKTENGKSIKYGLTYRSAALKASSGTALVELGVKTEIDLRADKEFAQSILPNQYEINFLQAGIMQGDYVLKDKSFYSQLTPEQIEEKRHSAAEFKQEYADALYQAFKLYTVESNYPILFHCTSGADRTGTFAFLLEGMLGVGLDDLYRDFELTSFAMGGRRWRSNIKRDENGKYYFNDDGYVTVPDNYVAIGLLAKGLMECYSTGDGRLSSAIKNYLKTDVGLTDEDFKAIEAIMLE